PTAHPPAPGRLRLGSGPDKTKAVFRGEITLCAGVFGNYRTTQRQKSRSAIANPAGAPRHVNPFNRRKFSERAGEVAAISASGAGDPVRIDNFPAEMAQSFSFGIFRSNVHRELKPRLRHTRWKIEVGFEGESFR